MHWYNRLLDWRSPVIDYFQTMDILIADKSLLLVSWNARHISRVYIPQLKSRYTSSNLAVILTVPFDSDAVDFVFINGFKKIVRHCRLQRLKLSEEAAVQLIKSFKPFPAFSLAKFDFKNQQVLDVAGFEVKVMIPELRSLLSDFEVRSVNLIPIIESHH